MSVLPFDNNILSQINALISESQEKDVFDHMCDECNIPLLPWKGNNYSCSQCGMLKRVSNNVGYSDVVHKNHNISSSNTSCLKMENGCFLDRSRFRNNNVNQPALQKKNIAEDFHKFNTRSEIKFPPNVMNEAVEIAFDILKSECHRNSPRRGIYAACIKAACMKHDIGISRKDIEYSDFVDTELKQLSFGESILKDKLNTDLSLNERKDDQKLNFIKRYMESLNLNSDYTDMIIRLIESVEQSNRFRGKNKETVWAGSLCYIYEKIDKKIKKRLCDDTKITASTFNKFKKCIDEYKEEYEDVLAEIEELVEQTKDADN
jgi:DNA-directed RNA polymerase subunit M/transcription elongation factor TFIIS